MKVQKDDSLNGAAYGLDESLRIHGKDLFSSAQRTVLADVAIYCKSAIANHDGINAYEWINDNITKFTEDLSRIT